MEELPDEAGVPFEEDEDVVHTAYHLHILKGPPLSHPRTSPHTPSRLTLHCTGQFDIYDEEYSHDGKTPPRTRGLTRLDFQDFEVHLVPSILKLDEDGYPFLLPPPPPALLPSHV